MDTKIQVKFHYNDLHKSATLSTIGRAKTKRPELMIEHLPNMSDIPRKHMVHIIQVLAWEVENYDLGDGAVVSIENYGHVRLEVGKNENGEHVFRAKDLEDSASDANNFIRRLMALVGFEHMTDGNPSKAIECFNVALQLQPSDAILLQSRASAKIDLWMSDSGTSFTSALDDLLLSIQLAPDLPGAYRDLLAVLQALSPQQVNQLEYNQWVSQIVEMALSHPTSNPDAIAERKALDKFAQEHRLLITE